MLPYARKYEVNPRGWSPFEVFQEILHKDEEGKVDLDENDLKNMIDIVESGQKFSLEDRYEHFFNGDGR